MSNTIRIGRQQCKDLYTLLARNSVDTKFFIVTPSMVKLLEELIKGLMKAEADRDEMLVIEVEPSDPEGERADHELAMLRDRE